MAVNVNVQAAASAVNRPRPAAWRRTWQSIATVFHSKVAVVGASMVLFWVLVAIFAPLVTRYHPLAGGDFEQDFKAINTSPSTEHWLGTDELGRDIWSRMAYGARIILVLAPLAVLCSLIVGTTFGLTAGYFGGWYDEVVMRILDSMMAFPTILLYLIILAAVGPSATNIVIAITIAGSPGVARLVRSLTLDIRTREYVSSAKLRGEHPLYIMFVEILPNARGPILVDAMLRVGYAVFAIGTLGFLGLGLRPPSPDWGNMVNTGRRFILAGQPWAALFPSLAIASLVVGLNLFADGLQEETTRYQ